MSISNQNKTEFRCECGNLIFKIVDEGIELKCKRCKRIRLVPFSKIDRKENIFSYIKQADFESI